jgi:hypothetical protein
MGSPVRSELQAKLQPTPVPAWVRDNIGIFYFLTNILKITLPNYISKYHLFWSCRVPNTLFTSYEVTRLMYTVVLEKVAAYMANLLAPNGTTRLHVLI